MKNQTVQVLADYIDIVTGIDRTIYIRCRKAADTEALAKGLALLLTGNTRIYLHQGTPILPGELEQITGLLLTGETVLFMYPGDTRFPVRMALAWDGLRPALGSGGEKPGFLAVVQVLDDEDPIPYEGATRWIYDEEVAAIETMGKKSGEEVIRIGADPHRE